MTTATRKKAVRHVDPDPLDPPPILTTRQLAMLLKSTHSTVYAWTLTDPVFAACIVRRTKRSTWWSTQRLRDAGYLAKGDRPSHA